MLFIRRTLLVFTIIIFCAATAPAMGRQDETEPQPVNGLENWDHSIDISGYEPGQYNILVRGTDLAGNTGTGGPYNIFIDPSVMIPSVSISTPSEGGRVGSILNVVGTASDDKQLARIEIAADDGNFQPAEGLEFWSAAIDCSSWPDGLHTLRARAVDADNNESPVAEVAFYKDTVNPLVEIDSHPSGSYISGLIELHGHLTDLNGVKNASVAFDRSEKRESLPIYKGAEEGLWEFRSRLDTTKMSDGAHVVHIEATDSLGSETRQAFLYYIDNSPPELTILSPADDDSQNGLITLAGTADDAVGLKELTYEADNGDSGTVGLIPGNPLWVLNLDYTGFKGRKASIRLKLTDIVGNSLVRTINPVIDSDGDLPLPGADPACFDKNYDHVPVITGMINDDDGSGGAVEYSLNKGEWSRIEVGGPWKINLSDAVEGENRIRLRAIDVNGLTGPTEEHGFTLAGPEPLVVIDSFSSGDVSLPWFPGKVLDAEEQNVLYGKFRGPSGLRKLLWSYNGAEVKTVSLEDPDSDGFRKFSLRLPGNRPSGRVDVKVFGQDESVHEFSAETVFYNYLPPVLKEGEQAPVYSIPDTGGIHLLTPVRKRDGFIMVDSDNVISGWTPDADIASSGLSGGGEFLEVETSGNGFRIIPKEEGFVEGAVLSLKLVNGRELRSEPLNIAVDSRPPAITVKSPMQGQTITDVINISAAVGDDTGDTSIYYSLDGGEHFTLLKPSAAESGASEYRESISLSGSEEGFLSLVIKASDRFGNQSYKHLPLFRDSKAPVISLINSGFERDAEQITIAGRVTDAGGIGEIKAFFPFHEGSPAEQGGADQAGATEREFSAVTQGGTFRLDVNLTTLGFEPSEILLRASDPAGNIAETRIPLNISLDAGRPTVRLHVPADGDSFECGFSLSGLILDREGISSISYSLNDGPWIDAGGGNLFTIPLDFDQFNDDLNTISVRAVDINGLESMEVSSRFRVSRKAPGISMDFPRLDSITRGIITLKGSASDENGIRNVRISHDNGSTFQKAEGTEDWSCVLDTGLLRNGITSLLLKAEDNAGVEGFYTTLINVDNRPPELSFSHPEDGEEFSRELAISGRAVDESGIESLKIILSPLSEGSDGFGNTVVRNIESRGTILQDLSLEGLAEGKYSFIAEAVDAAQNVSTVSRVITVLPPELRPAEILSPLPGEELGPRFRIEGYLPDYVPAVLIKTDGAVFGTAEVNPDGYFSYDVGPEDSFPTGGSVIGISIERDSESAVSDVIPVDYRPEGLWVKFDNIRERQFVSDRFVVTGSAGYEESASSAEDSPGRRTVRVAVSLDEGRSFENIPVRDGSWQYTLYSEEMPDGEHSLLVRAAADSGTAYARCRLRMDTRGPELSLLSPEENIRLYASLILYGEAFDESGLSGVSLSLREGNKDNYETPSFIQGMYFDASGLGATYFTAGLGLTFMDDNVKLQFQYGYAPTSYTDPDTNIQRTARFGGNVFGGKLLANLARIPFSWLFGPEFSAFSATAALGANFSYFSSNSTDDPNAWGVILAGIVGQLELPKIEFEDRSFLTYASLYWEGQLWLISSDISPEVILLPSIGLRIGLL